MEAAEKEIEESVLFVLEGKVLSVFLVLLLPGCGHMLLVSERWKPPPVERATQRRETAPVPGFLKEITKVVQAQ